MNYVDTLIMYRRPDLYSFNTKSLIYSSKLVNCIDAYIRDYSEIKPSDAKYRLCGYGFPVGKKSVWKVSKIGCSKNWGLHGLWLLDSCARRTRYWLSPAMRRLFKETGAWTNSGNLSSRYLSFSLFFSSNNRRLSDIWDLLKVSIGSKERAVIYSL